MKARAKKPPTKRPFVFINCAISADGKLAPATRDYQPFGSERDSRLMLRLRATADAILCGARTLEGFPTTLGPGGAKYRRLRLRHGLAEYALRIIVTGSGSISPDAAIFQKRFSPIIVLTTERAGARRLARLRQLADEVKVCGRDELNFRQAFRWLRQKWKIQRLLCEGGGELNAALLRAGLVNELCVTVCPFIFGGRDAPTLADGVGAEHLADATKLKLKSYRRVGDELFLVYRVVQ